MERTPTAEKSKRPDLPKHGQRVASHSAAVDEPRTRVGESAEALNLDTPDGVDVLGEELGETFVENVTGADDAAMEQSAARTTEEVGGPFVVTSGASEFAPGTDPSNPVDATREAFPTVSAPRRRR